EPGAHWAGENRGVQPRWEAARLRRRRPPGAVVGPERVAGGPCSPAGPHPDWTHSWGVVRDLQPRWEAPGFGEPRQHDRHLGRSRGQGTAYAPGALQNDVAGRLQPRWADTGGRR